MSNITDSGVLGEAGKGFVNASQQFAMKALSGAVESFSGRAQGALDDTLRGIVSGGMRPKDAIRGGIDSILSGGITDAFGGIENIGGGEWQSPKYAGDFIESWAPKHKFLFKVRFIFNDPFGSGMDTSAMEFFYAVKAIDKPKVTYDYDEVNMYNYRTKVLRMMHYEPLNVTFHDDIGNKVLNFFDYYRRCMSPHANRMSTMGGKPDPLAEAMGMSYEDFSAGKPTPGYTAGTGFLPNNQKNILKCIELIQIFAHGVDYNKFVFMNPKITNFDFDDVDHDVSDGNTMTASFEYDGLFVSYGNGRGGNFDDLQSFPGDNMQGRSRKSLPHTTNANEFYGQSVSYLMMPGNAQGSANAAAGGGFLTGIGRSLVQAGGAYLASKASSTISKAIMGSSAGKKLQNTAGAASGALGSLTRGIVGSGVNVIAKGLFGG